MSTLRHVEKSASSGVSQKIRLVLQHHVQKRFRLIYKTLSSNRSWPGCDLVVTSLRPRCDLDRCDVLCTTRKLADMQELKVHGSLRLGAFTLCSCLLSRRFQCFHSFTEKSLSVHTIVADHVLVNTKSYRINCMTVVVVKLIRRSVTAWKGNRPD